jgi:hypothetical protein
MLQITSLPRYPKYESTELPKATWSGTVLFLICSTIFALACIVVLSHIVAPILWIFLIPPFVYLLLAYITVFGSILIGVFVFARQHLESRDCPK